MLPLFALVLLLGIIFGDLHLLFDFLLAAFTFLLVILDDFGEILLQLLRVDDMCQVFLQLGKLLILNTFGQVLLKLFGIHDKLKVFLQLGDGVVFTCWFTNVAAIN